jgi:hypothetical protein
MSQRTDDSGRSVTLVEKNGRFFFFQPDVGVIASDESIESAYQKFLGARQAFQREVEQAGLAVGGNQGVSSEQQIMVAPAGRNILSELGLFVAKFCIALVLIAVISGVVVTRATNGIAAAIEHAIGPVKSISMGDVSLKAADVLKDLRSLTAQEKESLRQNIGAIARELEPMIDAWRNPPAKP